MNFKKFTQLSKLLRLLKGRIVGGAARNFLLNIQENKEIDIATPYHPNVAYNIVKATGINVIPLKLDHGTFLATYEKEKYEITTLRQDMTSIKNRWAKVEEAGTCFQISGCTEIWSNLLAVALTCSL